ncbi:MAG: hypothetical protein R3F54_16155 [Alphaproteobacteria bacterium]
MPDSSSAETKIITDTGKEHVGDVISAGVNTLTMKLTSSGYQIIPVKSIAWIKVDLADGSPIEGNFIDWSNGEMVVRVGDRDVGVSNGIITSVIDVNVAAGGPKLSAPPPPAYEPPPAEAPPVEAPATVEPAPAGNAPAPQPESVPTNATM